MHEAWKYSFGTTSIHELKRHSQLLSCLPPNIISFPTYRVQKHFHRSPVDATAAPHKKLRAQFYRIPRTREKCFLSEAHLYWLCHFWAQFSITHVDKEKWKSVASRWPAWSFLLIWHRRRVQRSLILALPPMLISAGWRVYFCAAACLSGVRFLCTQDTC